jgi:MFS family permease
VLNNLPRNRDFLIALTGRTVSAFGDAVAVVALTLRVQEQGGAPWQVALLLASGFLPPIALVRPIGRLVDARSSRSLLVGAGLMQFVCCLPLIVSHSIAVIVALVALLGAGTALASATWSALTPVLVGEARIPAAVSAQQSLTNLALVSGPAVGGLLAASAGSGWALAVDAASFLAVTLAALLIRRHRLTERDKPENKGATGGRWRSGFAVLGRDPLLRALLAGVTAIVLLLGMVDVVLVYLIRLTLRAPAWWLGVAEAAWMLGMVVGAMLSGRLAGDRQRATAVVAGAGAASAALGCYALASAPWELVMFGLLGGVGNGLASTGLATLLLTRTGDALRGRVAATVNAVVTAAQGASLLAGGVLAIALAPRAIYALAGLLGLLATGGTAAATRMALGRGHGAARASERQEGPPPA